MKKIKGTRYAHIGFSYHPTLEAEINRLEAQVLNQEARLTRIILELNKLLT